MHWFHSVCCFLVFTSSIFYGQLYSLLIEEGFFRWAGLSAEEIYRSVVKEGKLPPQYASIVGVGIPRELWKMIGECLQYKPLKRPTFHAMLAIFLRHLRGIHQSPTRPTA